MKYKDYNQVDPQCPSSNSESANSSSIGDLVPGSTDSRVLRVGQWSAGSSWDVWLVGVLSQLLQGHHKHRGVPVTLRNKLGIHFEFVYILETME